MSAFTCPMAISLAKATAILTSAFATGSTATYSFLFVPAILSGSPSESTLIAQWRTGYVIGYYATRPQLALAGLSWLYLAWATPLTSYGSGTAPATTRRLYLAAACIIPSILPFTVTVQRSLNGALSRRAERLAGPGSDTAPETFAVHDAASEQRERSTDTRMLVRSWARYNAVRTIILAIGTCMGTWAAVV